MIDFDAIDALVRYEICSDHNNGYRGFLKGPLVKTADRANDPLDQIRACLDAPMPDNAAIAHRPEMITDLSIAILPGNNLYLITITTDTELFTRARFGPGAAPLVLLPPNAGADHPFKQYGLYHLDGAKLSKWGHDEIPADHTKFSQDAWAGFACKFEDLHEFFSRRRSEPDQPAAVPFYFNLYDMSATGIAPIWETAGHPEASKHTETHGGIHPSDGSDVTTHGGIHPSSMVQYAYV